MSTKKCNRCEKIKALSEFFKDKDNKTDGHYSVCKTCKGESVKGWRENNREQYNAGMREYRLKNYQKMRLQRYKITPEKYESMLMAQNYRCAICKKLTMALKRPLAIDHCHDSNRVRGILCYNCNRGMHYIDDANFMEKALKYKNDSV